MLVLHATTGKSPPHLFPCLSILYHLHPLAASDFFDLIFPSFPGLALTRLPSWCPICCFGPFSVAHSGDMPCPLSFQFLYSFGNTFISVLDLNTSFLILYLLVIFSIAISVLFWVTASFLSCLLVRFQVSARNVVELHFSLSRHLSFRKMLYSPKRIHPDVIL